MLRRLRAHATEPRARRTSLFRHQDTGPQPGDQVKLRVDDFADLHRRQAAILSAASAISLSAACSSIYLFLGARKRTAEWRKKFWPESQRQASRLPCTPAGIAGQRRACLARLGRALSRCVFADRARYSSLRWFFRRNDRSLIAIMSTSPPTADVQAAFSESRNKIQHFVLLFVYPR